MTHDCCYLLYQPNSYKTFIKKKKKRKSELGPKTLILNFYYLYMPIFSHIFAVTIGTRHLTLMIKDSSCKSITPNF